MKIKLTFNKKTGEFNPVKLPNGEIWQYSIWQSETGPECHSSLTIKPPNTYMSTIYALWNEPRGLPKPYNEVVYTRHSQFISAVETCMDDFKKQMNAFAELQNEH